MIRRAQPELPRGPAHRGVLASHRHLEGPREIQHEVEDGTVASHVVMGVQVGREASHDFPERVDLRPQLDARLLRLGARRRVAGVPDEAPLLIDQRRHAPRIGDGPAESQVEMHPHPEARGLELLDLRGGNVAVHEERGARHDAPPARFQDAAAHPGGQAEVVGIDDEDLRARGHDVPITLRK